MIKTNLEKNLTEEQMADRDRLRAGYADETDAPQIYFDLADRTRVIYSPPDLSWHGTGGEADRLVLLILACECSLIRRMLVPTPDMLRAGDKFGGAGMCEATPVTDSVWRAMLTAFAKSVGVDLPEYTQEDRIDVEETRP